MSNTVYAPEKPKDCRNCYFWKNSKKGCCLGKENCYDLISVPPKPKSECDGCPYAEYREVKKDMQEFLVAKQTVEHILGIDRKKQEEEKKQQREEQR